MTELLFLRGAPGVGKSTLSKKLKSIFPKGITIEVGPILKQFNGFQDGDSTHYSNTLDCIYLLSLNYLEKGYHPILIIGPFKQKRMNNHFLSKNSNNYSIITLVAEDETLNYRIDNREIGFKDKVAAHITNSDMKDHRFGNELYIDTTYKSPDEILDEVKVFLNL